MSLFGTYASQVTRTRIESQARNLKTELLKGNVIQPQQMFDPSLVHPYDDIPPGTPTVMAEQDRFLQTLARYTQPTAGAIEAAAEKDASAARSRGTMLVAAAVGLAVAGAAAAFFGPAGAGIAAAAGAGGAAVMSGVGAAKKLKEASTAEQFTRMLAGWAEHIASPRDLIAIPASDGAQPFEYVQYVEGVMINQRRSAYP